MCQEILHDIGFLNLIIFRIYLFFKLTELQLSDETETQVF